MLYQMNPYYEVVVLGRNANELSRELRKEYLPQAVFAYTTVPQEEMPLFKGRYKEGETLIYICRDNSCGLPVKTIDEALIQLSNSN